MIDVIKVSFAAQKYNVFLDYDKKSFTFFTKLMNKRTNCLKEKVDSSVGIHLYNEEGYNEKGNLFRDSHFVAPTGIEPVFHA